MTYSDPNDPNDLRLPPKRTYANDTSTKSGTSMWVVGALAILAILGVLIYAASNTGTQTASTGTTTGAGQTTPAPGNVPQPTTTLPNPSAPAGPATSR